MPPEIKNQLKAPITWAWIGPVLLSIVLSLSGYSFLSTVEAAKREIATVNQTLSAKQQEACADITALQRNKLDKEQYYRDQDAIKLTLSNMASDIKTIIKIHTKP